MQMKALATLCSLALALMLSGCITTQQEVANAAADRDAKVKDEAKPVVKVDPKPRTPVRTRFIEI
jgi:starvation-inducible outer membrane lipoprotein